MNCYLYLSAGGGGRAATYRTIWISSGLALSLLIVATLALVRNFVMPWAVDGTVPRARIPVLPRIPLYCKGDLTTKKFIHTVDWSLKLSMLYGGSSSNHSRADPSKVTLNMWHQVGIAHLSTLAAVVEDKLANSPGKRGGGLLVIRFRQVIPFFFSGSFGLPVLVPSTSIIDEENVGDIMFVELIKKYDDSSEEELEEDDNIVTWEELGVEYFDKFPTRSELVYHKYLMCALILSLFLRNPIIVGGSPLNLKIPCKIGHVHVGKAYIDLNSPINIMTRMQYNWIMRKHLEPKEDPESLRGIRNFTGRVRGMHIFVENFTYVSDFVVVEDIGLAISPRLSQQWDSLSDIEKKHTQSIYFRNEEDKRRGVDYVMDKILGFYKECLELGPEYLTGIDESSGGSSTSEEGVTITTARRVSTVRRIKIRERIKMKIVYQDYLRDKRNLQEELFTHKEEMDLETTQTTTTAMLPILKQGEYDMWRLRIEKYIQVQDYALWDVIENGNSFKPVAQTTTNADGTSISLIQSPVTTDEKAQKKNDVKARSMLLIALPKEHLMTFNQYKDAKTLFAAIQTRFGGNDATKKTQKTLLKQINKPDLDIMSFNDLYNNFKIVEQEVKGTASSSSNSQSMAFVSSPSSTNEVNTAYGVGTTNTQVSPASTQVSTTNLSDVTVYAFLASQPNGSQLVYEDLKQIHEDDIEDMDLK
ncbi:hypothetical protein Tco_0680830 [Tanacetum coccineum]|uniref:Uncharacterized protein n=1 Tax=Tanacetum coccineum TaxID=301880 RepID=A0ABQ4XMG9_9ASTR